MLTENLYDERYAAKGLSQVLRGSDLYSLKINTCSITVTKTTKNVDEVGYQRRFFEIPYTKYISTVSGYVAENSSLSAALTHKCGREAAIWLRSIICVERRRSKLFEEV